VIGNPGSLLWANKRGWDDGDSVRAPVGCGACGGDYGVQQSVADLGLKPVELAQVSFLWNLCEFHFHREYPAAPLDDEVDFVVAAVCAQVTDLCPGGLRVCPDGLGYQRLEERAEEGSLPERFRSRRPSAQKRGCGWPRQIPARNIT
jgi:hypothetical protein